MRQEQLERLQELEEKLADVVLMECDPDLWPGSGVRPRELTQQERGDRYWCKKNAAATFALLQRTASLLTDASRPKGGEHGDDEDLDREVAKAEKEAAQILKKFTSTARGQS